METLEQVLPLCVYALLIVLLVITIIIGLKLIGAINKFNGVVNNVEKKINSLNGFFNVIDFTTDKISTFSDKLVELISGAINKIGTKKKIREEDEDDYE